MDIKTEIKEEDNLSDDVGSQNEREFFSKVATMRANSNAVLLDDACDVAIKTEIKSETLFTKHLEMQTQPEIITGTKHWEIDRTDIEQQNLISNFGSQKEGDVLPEEPIMKYNNCDEMDNKMIEMKEEPWWPETEASSVCGDIEDTQNEQLFTIKSPSLIKVGVSSHTSDLFSDEDLGSNRSFKMKSTPERESARECQSQERCVTDIPSIKISVYSQIPDVEEMVNMPSSLKQTNMIQQIKINKQDSNKEMCRSILSDEYRKLCKCYICEEKFKCWSTPHRLIHENMEAKGQDDCEARTQFQDLKRPKMIHEGINTHRGDICDKGLTDLSSLERSKLIQEGIKPHRCNICNKGFPQLQNLKRHKLIHDGIKPHKCDICNKGFTQLQDLKRHKLIHEGIKAHKCDICKKAYTDIRDLKRHKLIHEGIKPHRCDICDKAFTQLYDLKRHKLIHEGIKPHKCDICNKAYSELRILKRHKLFHEGIKPHKCDICNKAYTDLCDLKRHKLIHEGIKPHKCDICNKSYTDLRDLKRHKLIHEGIKPYKCDICNKTYTDLRILKRHKLIHDGIKAHKCDICYKAFTRLSSLKRHNLFHEGIKPERYNIRKKAYTDLCNLNAH